MSHLDLISDHSKEKLTTVPKNILDMNNLKMLFLEGNFLTILPDDLFWKLPRLMWLDLRNNLLEKLPASIAFHEKLENLLISNNNLERLPNELGTVPNLKALQISDNPIIYPDRKIIVEGTKAIKNFLKAEYDKTTKADDMSDRITELDENSQIDEDVEEQLIKTVELEDSEIFSSLTKLDDFVKSNPVKEETEAEKIRRKVSDQKCDNPDLEVKKLLPPSADRKKDRPVKIIHKVSREGSKIYLKSSFIKPTDEGAGEKTFKNLREGWLNEMKILLSDQERILQQERNLRAVANWRLKRKSESSECGPKVFRGDLPRPPFDTDPEYNRMPTRQELASQLTQFKQKGVIRLNDTFKNTPIELQRMIKDIMDQLKEMEIKYDPTNSNTDTKNAEQQMKTMMEIQKKLMNLKTINDTIM